MDRLKLVAEIQSLFVDRGWTLSLAESITAGRIASVLTEQSGASQFFMGSAVVYNNVVKQRILNVSGSSLQAFGAVSVPVAREMASAVKQEYDSDWAISTTGIAGPDGGSEDKPVGTVCFAIVGPGIDWYSIQKFEASSRAGVMNSAVDFAVKELWHLSRGQN